jgi:hypothetical protein
MARETVVYAPRARVTHVVVAPRVGSQDWVAYCSAKYRSFDPDTGTYVTLEGETVPCR